MCLSILNCLRCWPSFPYACNHHKFKMFDALVQEIRLDVVGGTVEYVGMYMHIFELGFSHRS